MNEHEKEEVWKMIMELAEEEGFMRCAYAGVALLNLNEEKEKRVREDVYKNKRYVTKV
jgi:hypothetical protein